MVNNPIDIHRLTLEELSGVVEIYPWYAGARLELCSRMASMGAVSANQLAQTALYIGSRARLYAIMNAESKTDCSDKDARMLFNSYLSGGSGTRSAGAPARHYIAGGDYFSREQYESVKRQDDGIFSRFAAKAREDGYVDPGLNDPEMDFCTEALARIYLEQDYKDEAIDIYSKLSLRYPEKSVYFAALIDEINKNYNNK